MEINIQ